MPGLTAYVGLAEIGTRAPQQLHDSAETAPAIGKRIHARVIVEILSVEKEMVPRAADA